MLGNLIDMFIRAFALGLFIHILLSWLAPGKLIELRKILEAVYEPFLRPIRRVVRPLKLSSSAPVGVDLAPVILLLLVWLFVHRFLMWVFS